MRHLANVLAFALGLFSLPLIASSEPAYVPCTLTSTNPVICLDHAGSVVGFYNNSATAQTAKVLCYDDATSATGTPVVSSAPLGETQVITLTPPGKPFYHGLVCQADASPTGAGIDVNVAR